MPQHHDDAGELVEAALRRVGNQVVLALPLALGKPVAIANEFCRRALRDASLDLTIVTALSLRRPAASSELERRLAGPLIERIFGDYEDLEYVRAERADRMPPNVRVIEFFLEPGVALDVPHAQRNYLSSNYTHVAREIARRGVNVVAQLVAARPGGAAPGAEPTYSLASNPDVTLDLLPYVAEARAAGRTVLAIAQVHRDMPYMYGHSELPASAFDFVLGPERHSRTLFCPPNPSLSTVDHAIGLHASALVRDGGTLQIGIGELGDSICYALLLRHQQNQAWAQALRDAGTERFAATVDELGGRAAFNDGLFGSTEMFVDQMLDLYRAGILRRRVYDSLPIMRLIARGQLAQRFDARVLEDLPEVGVGPRLDRAAFEALQRFGIFRRECRFEAGRIRSPEGELLEADLGDPAARRALATHCLGRELRGGAVMHAGFFLGPRGFYAALRDMNEQELRQFDMRGVGYINQLYGADHELRVLQRAHSRFVNTAMMITMLGAAVSDALDDGRVVSGVGGQYNFVSMAHALPGARSILCLRATRSKDGRTRSNLVWSYGHATIPRHLRDVVITEYGIADLRGRTDAECVAALLNVADSRFQQELLVAAQRAGKIASDYRIPEAFLGNTPQRLERAFGSHRAAGLFSEYPFGTDLTEEEIVLARALRRLKQETSTAAGRVGALVQALLARPRPEEAPYLARMGLSQPSGRSDRLQRGLVLAALRRGASAAAESGRKPAA